jgi:hypothetical protein
VSLSSFKPLCQRRIAKLGRNGRALMLSQSRLDIKQKMPVGYFESKAF